MAKKANETKAATKKAASKKSEVEQKETADSNVSDTNDVSADPVIEEKGSIEERQPESKQGKKEKYVVSTEFRDINNFNTVYKEGSDVSHLPKDRIDSLVALGYVEKK